MKEIRAFKTVRRAVAVAALAVAACMEMAAQSLVSNGVEFSPATYNFEEIDGMTESLRGEFVLRNVGTDGMKVVNVAPTCHCTTVEWSGEAVAPGDSCVISFIYNKESYATSVSKEINVWTSRSEDPVTLRFCGVIVESEASLKRKYPFRHGALAVESRVVSLGKVYRGGSKSDVVKVANMSGERVNVSVGECPEGVNVKVLNSLIGSLGEGNLRVKVENLQKWGWNVFEVPLVVNGEAVEPLKVEALVVPDFRDAEPKARNEGPYPLAESNVLVVDVPRGQKSGSASVSVENLGKQELEVYAAQAKSERVSVEFPGRVAANAAGVLKVRVDVSGLKAGEYSDKVYIVCNSPGAPVCEVRVVYRVR